MCDVLPMLSACISSLVFVTVCPRDLRLRGSVWPPVPDPGEVVRRLLKEVGTVIDSPTQGTTHDKGGSMGTVTGKAAVPEAQPLVVVVTSPDPEQTQLDPDPAQCDPAPRTPAEAPPEPPGPQCLLPSAPSSAPSTWTPGPLLTPGIDYISLE
uniref:Translation initiation factor IF-2-like isoform X1 n=1 Tax=Petromyzon marinus TaxID=7757 RepID=A0AAJ7T9S7_PETMA|nr:translation initiation factor IF-2-like isoform X1 [Petromyzon marinus]